MTNEEEDKDLKHFESFLVPAKDADKCIEEIDALIPKVVEANPGITTFELLLKIRKRMMSQFNMPHEKVQKAYVHFLGTNLGETIQSMGKTKEVNGRDYIQLKLF